MNKQTQEALKMAIEALMVGSKIADTFLPSDDRTIQISKAINACKEALEQLAQEPVAWMDKDTGGITSKKEVADKFGIDIPLYTHPHQWQELTDDEIAEIIGEPIDVMYSGDYEAYRAIEAKLKDKNAIS